MLAQASFRLFSVAFFFNVHYNLHSYTLHMLLASFNLIIQDAPALFNLIILNGFSMCIFQCKYRIAKKLRHNIFMNFT